MKNTDIRPGDKVRFLNDVGGGLVTRVEGKIVYVEDEIGFEVPMPANEIVVIERSEVAPQTSSASKSEQPLVKQSSPQEEPEMDEDGFAETDERHDDTQPRFYLAFLDGGHQGDKQMVDFHLVNDSNFYCLYLIVEIGEDGLARELYNGRIQPNTKESLDQLDASKLDVSWHIQVLLYRKDKPFALLDPVKEVMKIKAHKFFKDNAFKNNDFFYERAVLLPVIKNELERQMENLTKQETRKVLREKGELNSAAPKPSKKKNSDIIEVDLHIHELLDDTRGLSNADMLKLQIDRFTEVMEENQKTKGQKIVFIHGLGNGTLKHEVRRLLNTRYKSHNFQDASFREYGYGATMVII
ncbi:DUF2027 domain-containing protein [Marinilabilia salmonicolor]|uniref:DUF2027 domain-containing protein n=1 Tax=Marinilabilia salmonicolor TaxID=989 RepID=UPI00029A32E5|nr:DUF2027 domain-containing protein [Marinilabilia salmonicolor]